MRSEEEIKVEIKRVNKKICWLLNHPSLASFLIALLEPYKKALEWVLEKEKEES